MFAKAITAEEALEPFVRIKDLNNGSITGFSLNDWSFTDYDPAIFVNRHFYIERKTK